MSWISQNYEKAAIGVGVLTLAGLGFFGWKQLSSVEDDFHTESKGGHSGHTEVVGAEKVGLARNSIQQPRVAEEAKMPESGRPVDLFTSVPLFVKKGDTPLKPIDPISGEDIHKGIPNTWWLKYNIDPGFPDAPQRDTDGDGFTDGEEFAAKTDPTDPKSHPALISKLRYVKDESLEWRVEPGFPSEGAFGFKYTDSEKRSNRAGAVNPIKPGETFFTDGVMQGRFKLLGSAEREEENAHTHMKDKRLYVDIEDLKPNKTGVKYSIPSGMNETLKLTNSHFDRSAVLTLEALDEKGKEFKVEENTAFSLPPGSAKKEYLLKTVTPNGIEVEYTTPTGEKKTIPIPKGGMPAE